MLDEIGSAEFVEIAGSEDVETAGSVVFQIVLGVRYGGSDSGVDGRVADQAFFVCTVMKKLSVCNDYVTFCGVVWVLDAGVLTYMCKNVPWLTPA